MRLFFVKVSEEKAQPGKGKGTTTKDAKPKDSSARLAIIDGEEWNLADKKRKDVKDGRRDWQRNMQRVTARG